MKDPKDPGTIDMHKRTRGRPASGVSKAEQNRRNVQRAREKQAARLQKALDDIKCAAIDLKKKDKYADVSALARAYASMMNIDESDPLHANTVTELQERWTSAAATELESEPLSEHEARLPG